MIDEKRIQYHIKNNEIFAQLATLVDLQSQDISKKFGLAGQGYASLDIISEILMYLHSNCRCVYKKDKNKINPMKK